MRPQPTRKPAAGLEREAAREWSCGNPATAMRLLREAGYDEAARTEFLRQALGISEDALSDLELHRDSYLDWLDTVGGE
jgi:hypothetical protein